MIRRLLEVVGYYGVFLPSVGLQRVSRVVNDAIAAKVPLSLRGGSKKCAKVHGDGERR